MLFLGSLFVLLGAGPLVKASSGVLVSEKDKHPSKVVPYRPHGVFNRLLYGVSFAITMAAFIFIATQVFGAGGGS